MRASSTLLAAGLLSIGIAAAAAAQALPPPVLPPNAVSPYAGPSLRPTPNAPPPPGRGLCTEALPCRTALGEPFYYTPSGDKRLLGRR
ncbi:hypothetical protein ACFQS7_11155 [Dankookia sp. GCM10030260]|uniref:hypothetical protein n=1 Tax=Dankookia sp. GCM10030260 TaxID=3273390 RepID=UPI003606DCA8